MNLKKILFIGRFQPFHLGHLSVLKEISLRKDVEEIIVGVGSAQYNGTDENPYNYSFRRTLIAKSIESVIAKSVKISAIEDIHDNDLWVDHVIDIVGTIDEVYTGNDWVAQLFRERGYAVCAVKFSINITGTKLRQMIKGKNQEWKQYVSGKIINLISHAA